jgi:hypothetical protein
MGKAAREGKKMGAVHADDPTLTTLVQAEAGAILAVSREVNVPMRLIGSLAVRIRCPGLVGVMDALGRRPARDIDLVAYQRDERTIEGLFLQRAYALDPSIRQSREFGIKRLVFHEREGRYKVDVFLDELIMSHTIDLRGRLELDAETVSLADLLLSKLQIQEITENDLIDLAALLSAHPVGVPGATGIDLGHVASILGDDWGFHRTAHDNLSKLSEALDRFGAMSVTDAAAVRERAAAIVAELARTPKSRRWRRRARLGTRVRWYEEVEDVDR